MIIFKWKVANFEQYKVMLTLWIISPLLFETCRLKKNATDTNFLNVIILALIVLKYLVALVKVYYLIESGKKRKHQTLITCFLPFFLEGFWLDLGNRYTSIFLWIYVFVFVCSTMEIYRCINRVAICNEKRWPLLCFISS